VAFLLGLLSIGQLSVRPVFATTASDYLFFLAFAMTLAGILISRRAQGFVPGGIALGSGLLAVGVCASTFASDAPVASLGVSARVLYLTLIWFWLATVLLRSESDVRLGMCFWVVSLSVSGAAAFAQLLLGDVVPGTYAAYGRMTGTAQHFNDFGGSAAVALPAAAGLAFLSRGPARLVGLGGTVVIASGLLLSGSVGGMVAAAFGAAFGALVARRARSFWIIAIVVAAAAFATWQLQTSNGAETPFGRLQTVSASDGSLQARLDVFTMAWKRIADQPIVGAGFGLDPSSAEAQLPDLIHNAYLSTWYQGGLLALIGLVIVCYTSLRISLVSARNSLSRDELALAGALSGAFVSYLVFGLGEPTLYVRYGWVPVALVLALRAAQIRRTEEDFRR
jgi:O-antigen ligase